jgi:cyclin B
MKKSSNRRVLGDIGNIVGALNTKCVVRKQAAEAVNHVVGGKKSIAVANRPVTRQFGATLAKCQPSPQVAPEAGEGEQEHVQWGAKQRRAMPSKREKFNIKPDVENYAVSMENCKVLDSVSGPPRIVTRSLAASLKMNLLKIDENEPILVDSAVDDQEDMDESTEMETEEAEDPVLNIDEGDAGNPLAAVDYIQDMSRFYRQTEVLSCVPPDYMSRQTDINHIMRDFVVDWIIEVHWKYGLEPETLFLAINLMDRYLSSQRDLSRIVLQLVGITAMLVASKYEETNVPRVQDFMTISKQFYTGNDVVQMEKSMLRTLQFNISVPTPYVFLNRFLKAAQADKQLEMVSFFLAELCLVEYVMLRYPPSMLAAAAVYTGQFTLRRFPSWNRTMECYTAYSEDQLQECAKLMVSFHQNSGIGRLITVHKKYSRKEFGSVAELEPALFIIQRYL